jgi:hypothetical protein
MDPIVVAAKPPALVAALAFALAFVFGAVAKGVNFCTRWEGLGSVEDVGNRIVGGILMGFGGVTALGCTIGQGLTGISTLAVGSIPRVRGHHRRLRGARPLPDLATGEDGVGRFRRPNAKGP